MAQIGTRKLKIEIDGDDYTFDVSNARFTSGGADADFLSFGQANQGGSREYRLVGTVAQDLATTALWRKVWDNVGDEVVATIMPYGNAVASVSEPHVQATVTIEEPDGDMLGGEANASKSARMTGEISWPCDAKPTLITV